MSEKTIWDEINALTNFPSQLRVDIEGEWPNARWIRLYCHGKWQTDLLAQSQAEIDWWLALAKAPELLKTVTGFIDIIKT